MEYSFLNKLTNNNRTLFGWNILRNLKAQILCLKDEERRSGMEKINLSEAIFSSF